VTHGSGMTKIMAAGGPLMTHGGRRWNSALTGGASTLTTIYNKMILN